MTTPIILFWVGTIFIFVWLFMGRPKGMILIVDKEDQERHEKNVKRWRIAFRIGMSLWVGATLFAIFT